MNAPIMNSTFFDSHDLAVLEAISRGKYMTLGMQGKNVRQYLHGLIEKIPGFYRYLITALGKEIIVVGLTVKNLIIVPALASYFLMSKILPVALKIVYK